MAQVSLFLPVVRRRYTTHALGCPSLQILAMACRSMAGFQSESYSTKRFAPIRFKPAPPALVDSRQTCKSDYVGLPHAKSHYSKHSARWQKAIYSMVNYAQVTCLPDKCEGATLQEHERATALRPFNRGILTMEEIYCWLLRDSAKTFALLYRLKLVTMS